MDHDEREEPSDPTVAALKPWVPPVLTTVAMEETELLGTGVGPDYGSFS